MPIPRVTDEITIDARLDEPAWSRAARLTGFSQYQPVDQRPAEEPTEVRVLYTPQAIYFAIVATSTDPGGVRATLSKRDNIGNDDRVTVYLDTFNDRRRAFFFGANALGVQLDGVRTEGGLSAGDMFGGGVDLNPDFRFETKGQLTESGYLIEMRIPFKSLRFPAADPQQWGIQVVRQIPGRNAEDTWTDAQRGASSFLAQSGTLTGITQVERGVVTDVQPFVTQSFAGSRDAATGAFTRSDRQFDAGVNLRLGFPAIAIDATINPDFSQVEADAGLVTVNERFALFLPERRPFFLEGIELFATPNQLVYSRTIANPIAGAKVSGKVGRLSLAYLSAIDEAGDARDAVNVARVRTDYGHNSVAGLTVTDRRGRGEANSVVAADTRVVFREKYTFQSQFGQSLTTTGEETTSAPVWSADIDRTGRTWGFNYSVNAIGDRFASAAGFVPRVGFQTAHAYNRIAFLGGPSARIQNLTLFGGPTRIWRYGSLARRDQIEGTDEVMSFITLRGGWSLMPSVRRNFIAIDPSVASGLFHRDAGGVLIPWAPSGRLSGMWTTSFGVTTPVFARFNASVDASQGEVPIYAEGAPGRSLRWSGSLTVRPTPETRLEGTLTHSRITREGTGREYARVLIPRLKAEYQPTRALFFRVVSQFRSDRVDAPRDPASGLPLLTSTGLARSPRDVRSLRTDWLVQYEPSPGTTAFFGYGDTWTSPGAVSDTDLRRTADGFFLKLAYLFRR
ncbi:MAG: carbohydrate binding family 9 domain-containing protein [Gemmatimonadaceae bacterium]|nr:carbohydrate binding family 9 domain-containing protein [Gemmatimonadaceae bacterium]